MFGDFGRSSVSLFKRKGIQQRVRNVGESSLACVMDLMQIVLGVWVQNLSQIDKNIELEGNAKKEAATAGRNMREYAEICKTMREYVGIYRNI